MIRKLDDLPFALPVEAIADFCRRWKIARLEVFGSALRDDFRPDSDIDFLYTFSEVAPWGWEFFDAEVELSQLMGRPVDLVSRKAVERSENYLRRRAILSSTRVVYES